MASAWFREVCNWLTWARRAASAAVSPTPGVGVVPTVFCASAMAASRVSFHFLPLQPLRARRLRDDELADPLDVLRRDLVLLHQPGAERRGGLDLRLVGRLGSEVAGHCDVDALGDPRLIQVDHLVEPAGLQDAALGSHKILVKDGPPTPLMRLRNALHRHARVDRRVVDDKGFDLADVAFLLAAGVARQLRRDIGDRRPCQRGRTALQQRLDLGLQPGALGLGGGEVRLQVRQLRLELAHLVPESGQLAVIHRLRRRGGGSARPDRHRAHLFKQGLLPVLALQPLKAGRAGDDELADALDRGLRKAVFIQQPGAELRQRVHLGGVGHGLIEVARHVDVDAVVDPRLIAGDDLVDRIGLLDRAVGGDKVLADDAGPLARWACATRSAPTSGRTPVWLITRYWMSVGGRLTKRAASRGSLAMMSTIVGSAGPPPPDWSRAICLSSLSILARSSTASCPTSRSRIAP